MSLRELFVWLTIGVVAVAGLAGGPPVSWIGVFVLLLAIAAMLIDLMVAPKARRVFAIGFLVPTVLYLSVVVVVGEFDIEHNSLAVLPTTTLIQSIMRPGFGNAFDEDVFRIRQENAKTVIPLGHLTAAFLFGFLGGLYARWTSRAPRNRSTNEPRNLDDARIAAGPSHTT